MSHGRWFSMGPKVMLSNYCVNAKIAEKSKRLQRIGPRRATTATAMRLLKWTTGDHTAINAIYVTFELGLVSLRVAVGAYRLNCNWFHWSLSDFNSILLLLRFCLCSQLAGCFICLCFARTNTHYLYTWDCRHACTSYSSLYYLLYFYIYIQQIWVCVHWP